MIYAPAMLELRRHVEVHAFAHITGGGLVANIDRILPKHCDAVLTRGRWETPRIFSVIQEAGSVTDAEMERVFNLGMGMVAVVPEGRHEDAIDTIRRAGHDCWLVGEVVSGHGQTRLV